MAFFKKVKEGIQKSVAEHNANQKKQELAVYGPEGRRGFESKKRLEEKKAFVESKYKTKVELAGVRGQESALRFSGYERRLPKKVKGATYVRRNPVNYDIFGGTLSEAPARYKNVGGGKVQNRRTGEVKTIKELKKKKRQHIYADIDFDDIMFS